MAQKLGAPCDSQACIACFRARIAVIQIATEKRSRAIVWPSEHLAQPGTRGLPPIHRFAFLGRRRDGCERRSTPVPAEAPAVLVCQMRGRLFQALERFCVQTCHNAHCFCGALRHQSCSRAAASIIQSPAASDWRDYVDHGIGLLGPRRIWPRGLPAVSEAPECARRSSRQAGRIGDLRR